MAAYDVESGGTEVRACVGGYYEGRRQVGMFGDPTVEDRNTDPVVDRDVFGRDGDEAFMRSVPVGE